ncbi:hypothetical protein PAXRUDRAFT_16629 [Paxillus rubicundulus Ve08.2h10]|uniref:Uncharacterized protein n=1 Tax=Paxillus rubicundulus Ve08.2h10 TaxID=930991 RepID=A0A0D0DKX5_9AGAM|nr:hypothetical protein PAXRUDRAFT_16629 [Paxillus rubicundulus Ve08.2h10]
MAPDKSKQDQMFGPWRLCLVQDPGLPENPPSAMHNNTVKRCRHSPHCYQFLKPETRRRHYATANAAEILPSDYGSDDDPQAAEILPSDVGNDDLDDSDSSGPMDIDGPGDEDLPVPQAGSERLRYGSRSHSRMEIQVPLPGHLSSEQEHESGNSDFLSDCSSCEISGHLVFDEHEEASAQLEAELDDDIERLRDWYGPGLEKKFHNARKQTYTQ